MKNFKKLYVAFIGALFVLANGSFVFAAEGDWGLNIKDWILRQASALAIAAIVIVIVPLIYKKAWSALIGTIFASGVGLYFVNNPEAMKKIGDAIYGVVFK